MKNSQLFFAPKIWIKAEHAADMLGISLEKANQLLSRPDTNDILKAAMHRAVQDALLQTLQQMARVPHETVPTRIDCAVALPPLPIVDLTCDGRTRHTECTQNENSWAFLSKNVPELKET